MSNIILYGLLALAATQDDNKVSLTDNVNSCCRELEYVSRLSTVYWWSFEKICRIDKRIGTLGLLSKKYMWYCGKSCLEESPTFKHRCYIISCLLFTDQNSSSGGQGSMSVSVPNLTSSRQEPISLLESFANLASRNFGCNNKTANTTASNLLRALSCNRATTGQCQWHVLLSTKFCWKLSWVRATSLKIILDIYIYNNTRLFMVRVYWRFLYLSSCYLFFGGKASICIYFI